MVFCLSLFLAVLGLCCCVDFLSTCSERGLLVVAVWRLLFGMASLVMEHGRQWLRLPGSGTQTQ